MPAVAALDHDEAYKYLGGIGRTTLYTKAKEHGVRQNIMGRWPISELDRLANILKPE